MPTNPDVLRPLPRNKPMVLGTNPTVRGRAITVPTMKAGPLTQSFFARGEEQEASGYQNLAMDDPVLDPAALEFDSFDKIPRKRGSWFALGISTVVLLAVGVVTWRSFHLISRPGSSVAAASRAMVQSPPAGPAAPVPAPLPVPTLSVESASPPAAAAPPISPPETPPSAENSPSAPAAPAARRAPSAPPATHVAPVIVPLPPRHARAREKHQPLRGYVWSPEKHTIVPTEPAKGDSVPDETSRAQTLEGTPAEEPQPARERTTPAPFDPRPAPAPSEEAPVVE